MAKRCAFERQVSTTVTRCPLYTLLTGVEDTAGISQLDDHGSTVQVSVRRVPTPAPLWQSIDRLLLLSHSREREHKHLYLTPSPSALWVSKDYDEGRTGSEPVPVRQVPVENTLSPSSCIPQS